MADNKCIAITYKGTRCTIKKAQGDRCNIHASVLEDEGPTRVVYDEHNRKFTYLKKKINAKYNELLVQITNPEERKHLRKEFNDELNDLQFTKEADLADIERQAPERVAGDQLAQQRRDERRAREMVAWQNAIANNDVARPVVVNNNPLHNVAIDQQSVHTVVVVKNVVNKAIDKLLKIEVPEEYRWNTKSVSKTVVEIMGKCNLSVPAARDLCTKYLGDDNIYYLGRGIYGRTLDGVWQYIINKKDNEDMIKVLKQELEDNIGKCSQGQLTRICNILAGYIEDIGVGESVSEILGREFSKLMEIETLTERLSKGIEILEQNGLPEDKWSDWLKPLEN